MNISAIGKLLALGSLSMAGLLFWSLVPQQPAGSQANAHISERVNLALRRTAHQLLIESGDTTSRILPVEHPDENVWFIRLERRFNYDRLPVLLQESFAVQQVSQNYNVTVLDCSDGALQLGYNFLDFKENNSATCGGRELTGGCYNLQVTFLAAPAMPWNKALIGLFLLGGLGAFGLFYRKKLKNRTASAKEDAPEMAQEGLTFGNSSLDVANQILLSNGIRQELTYREAKLLQLFVSHQNQLLERDFILKSVWEDEGIVVGRSVDVFVSRLRKMLREDEQVQLNAVHGVGYRLNC